MLVVNARFLTQQITGVQRAAIEISLRLKKIYKDVKFVSPKNVIHEELSDTLDVEKYGNFSGHLWEQFELPKYLKSRGNCLLLNLANTAPLFYKNKIVTIYDVAFLKNPHWFSKKFYHFYRFVIPRIANNSLMIATVSEFSKKEIIEHLHIPESKIEVVCIAVSEKFMNSPNKHLKNKYGDYILAVTSLNPRKNIERILLAFEQLDMSDVKLVIVGCNDKNVTDHNLRKLIPSNSKIIFAGYKSDDELIGLYQNARMLVFPSLYEGFGFPPLEAMACGCPCVVSNVSALPEICGDATLYCDPYRIEDIADKINKLLNDINLSTRLTELGFKHVKKFSWQKAAETFVELINKAPSA